MKNLVKYIKCILFVILYSLLPMIMRIIGTFFLTKYTDDYAQMYKTAAYQYGVNSNELKLVVDYGGTYFTWIGLLIIALLFFRVIKNEKVLSKSKFGCIPLWVGLLLASIMVITNNSVSDLLDYKALWIFCYVLQTILVIFVEELIFRYECLKQLKDTSIYVQYLFPLVLYIFLQDNVYDAIFGLILYSISFILYKKTNNLTTSLLFNLGLNIGILISGLIIKKEYILVIAVISIILLIISSLRVSKNES